MATRRESSDDEKETEETVLEKEISELRSAKRELFEWTRPVNEELQRIAQRERECVDRLRSLAAEKHDRDKHQQTVQRLIELESEIKRLKCENVKLSDTNKQLKRSLDQAARYSRRNVELARRVTDAELKLDLATAAAQTRSESTDSSATVDRLQNELSATHKLLNKTKLELNETRQRLREVQERLTVADQLTLITQQRAMFESDNAEELLRELALQLPATQTG